MKVMKFHESHVDFRNTLTFKFLQPHNFHNFHIMAKSRYYEHYYEPKLLCQKLKKKTVSMLQVNLYCAVKKSEIEYEKKKKVFELAMERYIFVSLSLFIIQYCIINCQFRLINIENIVSNYSTLHMLSLQCIKKT